MAPLPRFPWCLEVDCEPCDVLKDSLYFLAGLKVAYCYNYLGGLGGDSPEVHVNGVALIDCHYDCVDSLLALGEVNLDAIVDDENLLDLD